LSVPTVVPKVHAGAVATPDEFVFTVTGVAKVPPPAVTEKVMGAFGTVLLKASRASTVGAIASAVPITAESSPPVSTVNCATLLAGEIVNEAEVPVIAPPVCVAVTV
jgi:hypothetical protein